MQLFDLQAHFFANAWCEKNSVQGLRDLFLKVVAGSSWNIFFLSVHTKQNKSMTSTTFFRNSFQNDLSLLEHKPDIE